MPVLPAPSLKQKMTLLAPNSPAAPATNRLVNSRQGVRMMNPGVISKSIYCWASKRTPTSCFFGRYGDFDLSQKPAIFSGDIRSHLSKFAPATFVRMEEGEGSHTTGLVMLRRSRCPRAYMDFQHGIPFPVPMKKPDWWWRTLACVPYLMALQLSDTAFYFQPLMECYEQFEFLSYYVPGAIRRLPSWFLMVYCFLVYVGVVRSKQWPHFFRYHVMMGLLLENALQIVWHASNFMPLINYWGKFRMPYWAMVGLTFITLMLECIRCALAGKYVAIPFISDAAFLHTPYARGDL